MFEGAAKGGGWVVSGTNSMTLVGKSRTNEQPLLQPWTSCHWGFGHAVKRMREEQMPDSRQKGLIEGGLYGWLFGGNCGAIRPQSNSQDSNDNNTTFYNYKNARHSTSKTVFHISRNFHCYACLFPFAYGCYLWFKYLNTHVCMFLALLHFNIQ